MIRVLVADDSATARALLVGIFSAESDIDVVGEAPNGQDAVDMAERLRPDLITMDVQMPGIDGLEATKRIMVRAPCPIIIISSTARVDEVRLSLDATRSGALMVIPKPEGPAAAGFDTDRRFIVSMARAMSQVKVVRRHGATSPFSMATPPQRPAEARPRLRVATSSSGARLIAIGASTGGPAALRTILAALPAWLPVPVLVVQHIAHGFMPGLVQWLAGDTRLRVKVAELGEPALAGTAYLAPDDLHLGCRRDARGELRIVLDNAERSGAFRPSATYLFRSAAAALGAEMVAVILTGMGDDGVDGLRDVKAAGGHVIAQDEASSVIYGMPREAKRAGVVDSVLGLDAIAKVLVERVS